MTDIAEPENLVLRQLREMRAEQAQQRTLLLQVADYMRKMEQRLDARIVSVRDDLEIMLKVELLGRTTHFETRLEQRIDALEDRMAKLERGE